MKRPTKPTLSVVAVVVIAALAAATSHTSVWAPARSGGADPVTLLMMVAGAFLLCVAATGALSLAMGRDAKRTLHGWLPGIVVVTAIVSLLGISRVELRPERAATVDVERADPTSSRPGVRLRSDWRGPAVRRQGEDARADDPGAVVSDRVRALRRLLLVVGALALALLIFLRRPGRDGARAEGPFGAPPDQAAREAAHGAVVGTIEAMLADPDPRTAIIGAYARLQEELAGNDASRKEYEGPTEHLHRVLRVLDVRPAPLADLIRLFEIARFSDHSLTASHRDEALEALREVAGDLATPAAPSLSESIG